MPKRCKSPQPTIPRKHLSIIALTFFAISALTLSCFSQANSPATSQTEPVKTSVAPAAIIDVNEVSLNLMVHDKKNKLILDLKPEDIAVTDGGAPVKITDLRLVNGITYDHLLTLVFDRLDSGAAHNAHDIATKILKEFPTSGFSFCILKTEERLRLYQNFTSDRPALGNAIHLATDADKTAKEDSAELPEKNLISIAKTGADESGARVSSKDRALAQSVLAGLEESQRIVQDQHSQPSLSGLLALARTQRKIAGRKIVIYFTQGLQTDADAADILHSIAGAANRSDVSIYVIDPNASDTTEMQGLLQTAAIGGVMAAKAQAGPSPLFVGNQPVAQQVPGLGPETNNQLDRYETEGLSGRKNPFAELAISTGGAYIGAGNNLKKPLHQLIADMNTYYEASYVPPVQEQEYDGRFHPVTIKAVRGGLKMRSQPGYFAAPQDNNSGIRPFEAPLLKILGEPLLPNDLKFRSQVLRLGELPEGNANALIVEVPLSELEIRQDPNADLFSVHLSIVARIKNKAGDVVEHFSEDIPRHGALESMEAAKSETITLQRHFIAGPGSYVMEAAILDRASGKASAQRVEFEILNETGGPSLSDLAMVQRTTPFPEEIDESEPLRYGKGKMVPGLSGRVSHGTKSVSFFFVVHPDPNSAEQPRLEMEILRNQESLTQVPLQLRKTNGPATIPYLAEIQSASLPGGDYEVVERLTQNGKIAERSLAFKIEGPELARVTAPETGTVDDGSESIPASLLQATESDGKSGHRLLITSLPAGALPTPSADDLQAIVAEARKRALDYSRALPNFICAEVTNRSVDNGNGIWRHRDSIAELLRYYDNQESRTTIEVNGKRSSLKRADLNSTWPLSVGEFGAMLNLVFQPHSKTAFEWKETGALENGSGTVQVFSYRVAPGDATITLSQGNDQIGVGFHGLVYIDSATSGVRRITLEADNLPHDFPIHGASMTVDYDYVSIAAHDYLLPVHSTVSLQRRRKAIELNEITFRNYRRFASRTKMKFVQ